MTPAISLGGYSSPIRKKMMAEVCSAQMLLLKPNMLKTRPLKPMKLPLAIFYGPVYFRSIHKCLMKIGRSDKKQFLNVGPTPKCSPVFLLMKINF